MQSAMHSAEETSIVITYTRGVSSLYPSPSRRLIGSSRIMPSCARPMRLKVWMGSASPQKASSAECSWKYVVQKYRHTTLL